MRKHFLAILLLSTLALPAFASGPTQQPAILQVQNNGTVVGTTANYFVLNLVSGCTATQSGNTFSLTCTGGGAITPTSITINDTASNLDLILDNTTAGTSSSQNGSPSIGFSANAYTGSASSSSSWVGYSLEGVAASGNGTTHLIFNRVPYSGSIGFPPRVA